MFGMFLYCIQKLLLLPELSGTAITGSDVIKTTHALHSMPTVKLVNEESTNDSRHGSFSNGVVSAKISVNDLTASWTHVRTGYFVTADFIIIFRTKRN